MTDKYGIQKLLGKKGFSGPIFLVNQANGMPMRDDDDSVLYMTKRNGTQITGFYSVKADVSGDLFTARLAISGFKSKIDFLLRKSPLVKIVYNVDDIGEVLDSDGAIVTPGTFSTYFSTDVVKVAGKCEQWSAIDLVLSLTGSASFQSVFPVSFASSEGFNTASITQANINTANAS